MVTAQGFVTFGGTKQQGPSRQEIDQIMAYYKAGDYAAAEPLARSLTQRFPDNAFGWKALGTITWQNGSKQESVHAMQETIRLSPGDPEAFNTLASAYLHLGRSTESEASYREAIRLKPNYAKAFNNLGNVLNDLGRMTEAEVNYRNALKLRPYYAEAHSNLLFSLNYIESLSPVAALIEASQYGSIVSAQKKPKFTSWGEDREPTILRVGFVSGDLNNHPVGFFLEGFLNHLPSNRCDIYAFPTRPFSDDLTERIKPLFRDWIPLYGKSDLDAAKIIHNLGIHILIDLSGHTAHNRLPVFSHKPAPVQISWLGYFATTGLPEIDYFLGDPTMSPKCEHHHFTERVWNLPETWFCFTTPSQPIPILPLPALANGYVTFGCCGNLSKIGKEVIKIWSTILKRVPGSNILLKSRQLADAQVRANVHSKFANHGIPDSRIILEGVSRRNKYFETYNRIDMVLDTFPYPGGTTSAEALWMGVPVLTLRGDRFLSHLGESIAINSGQADWIAKDHNDYVDKAVSYASNLHSLSEMRATLRERVLQTPLFDNRRFAKNFEKTLLAIYSNAIR